MIRKLLLKADIADIKFYYVALVLLPLLIFYTLIVIKFSPNGLVRDEWGFLLYANRILTGQYFSNPKDIQLWWGIGYPLVISPFVALHIPNIAIKLLNPLFLCGAILFLYNTLKSYIRPIIALIIAFVFGLYLPFLNELQLINNDTITYFIVFGLVYFSCRLLKQDFFSVIDLLLAAFFMAYLALTKVFYGYMILIFLVLYSVYFIWSRNKKVRLMLLMYAIALIICVPYLIGTYVLTGKVFYWGTSGGMSLYWMSTPYSDEWGDWFSVENVMSMPELNKNHGMDIQEVSSLSEPAMDAAYKEKAIQNIVHNPKKFLINWLANIGRLLFEYPYSYVQQTIRTYYYMLPNAIFVTLLLISFVPALLRWEQIPFEIKILPFFAILAFLGTSILSGYVRFFTAVVPFLIVWMAYIYIRVVKFQLIS
jgi:hypothetical protein